MCVQNNFIRRRLVLCKDPVCVCVCVCVCLVQLGLAALVLV
jgi:hypothetical protein